MKGASASVGVLCENVWLSRYSRGHARVLPCGSSLQGWMSYPGLGPVLRTPLPGASFCVGFGRRLRQAGDPRMGEG